MRAVKRLLLIGLLVAAGTLGTLDPADGARTSRACAPAALAGTRTPLIVEERGGSQVRSLRAGRRYSAVVVQELAIGDMGGPRDGSFVVSSPTGVELARTTADGRPAWDFTARGPGPVRLDVAWLHEPDDNPSDVCAASGGVSLPVMTPEPVRVGAGRMQRARGFADTFLLPLLPVVTADPSPVTVKLRLRKGSARPPAARGRATVSWVVQPEDGDFGALRGPRSLWLRALGLHVDFEPGSPGVGFGVSPDGNIAFGRALRFGFSFEVRQAGRLLGGFRGGGSCRRIQQRSFSVMRCSATWPGAAALSPTPRGRARRRRGRTPGARARAASDRGRRRSAARPAPRASSAPGGRRARHRRRGDRRPAP